MLFLPYVFAGLTAAEAGRFDTDYANPDSSGFSGEMIGSNPDNSTWRYTFQEHAFFPWAGKLEKLGDAPPVKFPKATLSLGFLPYLPALFYIEKNNSLTIANAANLNQTLNVNGSLAEGPNVVARNGFMLTGLGTNGHALYWNYKDERGNATIDKWIDLGGNFSKTPVGISGAPLTTPKVDIFGVSSDNKLLYKYFTLGRNNERVWYPSKSEFAAFDNGTYYDQVVITTTYWGGGPTPKYNLWVLGSRHNLLHTSWDGKNFSEWEDLGGRFDKVPAIFEIDENRFEIWARNLTDNGYWYKRFADNKWVPEYRQWRPLGGNFVTEPAILKVHAAVIAPVAPLVVAGVQSNGTLSYQPYFPDNPYNHSGLVFGRWIHDVANVTKTPPASSQRRLPEEL